MIPTIDIGVFGWVAVIATYIRVAWSYIEKGFSWIIKKSLAIYLGSKFWGLFFFVAIFSLLIGLLAKILNVVNSLALNWLVTGLLDVDSNVLAFAGFLRVGYIVRLISAALSALEIFLTIEHSATFHRLLATCLRELRSSWKL